MDPLQHAGGRRVHRGVSAGLLPRDRAPRPGGRMSTEEVWERRAHPATVWSRLAALPLFAAALWSRQWFDPWYLLALLVLLGWSIAAPRLIPPPASTASWVSRATFGARVR